jgi:hypothetical protein
MTALLNAGQDDRRARAWLAGLVFAFDELLRHKRQVIEFSADPMCIFRLQIGRADQTFALSDGTHVRPGDRIIHLHFWNEQIPRVPPRGPTIAWARQFCRSMELSLCELSRYCASRPELCDIAAISANVTQGTRQQRQQITRLMRRFGFECPPDLDAIQPDDRLRRLGENIFISAIVLAHNPVALRVDTLWRDRAQLFLSRTALARRFGDLAASGDARPHADSPWRMR